MSDPPAWMFCCDPGLVSGVAILHWNAEDGIVKVSSAECSLGETGHMARGFLQTHGSREAEVVVERFTITPETAKNSQAPWSLKVCGAIEWLVWDFWNLDGEKTVHYQGPSEAKKLVPNDVLRTFGLWHRGGAGHARDALRHGAYRYATAHGVRSAWIG